MLRRIVALLVLVAAFVLVWFLISLFQPFTGSGHGRVKVTIPQGSGVSKIGSLLEHDGVVSSGFFFKLAATIDGDRGKLHAGQYNMKLGMSYNAALDQLVAGPNIQFANITIIPGRSRKQVQAELKADGVKEDYVRATLRSSLLDPRGLRRTQTHADARGLPLAGHLQPAQACEARPADRRPAQAVQTGVRTGQVRLREVEEPDGLRRAQDRIADQ